MNPIEEFYKVKNTYEVTKEVSEKFHSIFSLDIIGSLAEDWKIAILLDNSSFTKIETDERWEIYKAIKEYIGEHREEIKTYVTKELKKRMEEARGKVLEDFKLIGEGSNKKK